MPVAKRHSSKLFLGLTEVVAILVATFSVATIFDEWHRYLELFSHFRLQYLFAALILCAVFLFYRRRGYLFATAIVLVLNAAIVVPWYFANTATAAEGTSFKLLYANVLESNNSAERFVEWADGEAPDLLVVQELTPEWLTAMKSVASQYPFLVLEPRTDAFGIGLFSHFPLEDVEVRTSEPRGLPEIHATIFIGDRKLRLVSAHPMPPLGKHNYAARNTQLAALGTAVSAQNMPVVVIGDLNTSMWANHYRQLEETTGLTNARRGFGIRPSWPLFFPPAMIPIDHCLISPDIAVLDFRSGPNIGSDHLPLITTLVLKTK